MVMAAIPNNLRVQLIIMVRRRLDSHCKILLAACNAKNVGLSKGVGTKGYGTGCVCVSPYSLPPERFDIVTNSLPPKFPVAACCQRYLRDKQQFSLGY